jgi:hypothetical protein
MPVTTGGTVVGGMSRDYHRSMQVGNGSFRCLPFTHVDDCCGDGRQTCSRPAIPTNHSEAHSRLCKTSDLFALSWPVDTPAGRLVLGSGLCDPTPAASATIQRPP